MKTLIETIMLRLLAEVENSGSIQEAASAIQDDRSINAVLKLYIERAIELYEKHEQEILDVETNAVDPFMFTDLVGGDRRKVALRMGLNAMVRKVAKNNLLSAKDEESLVELFAESVDNIPGCMTIGVNYGALGEYHDIDGIVRNRMEFLLLTSGDWGQIDWDQMNNP